MTVLVGQTTSGTSADSGAAGNTVVWPFVASANGTAVRIVCQLKVANAGFSAARLGFYSNSGSAPSGATPLDVASVNSLAAAQGTGQFDATLTGAVSIVSGTTYWLGFCGVGEQIDLQGSALAGKEGTGNFPNSTQFSGTMSFAPVIWIEDAGTPAIVNVPAFHPILPRLRMPGKAMLPILKPYEYVGGDIVVVSFVVADDTGTASAEDFVLVAGIPGTETGTSTDATSLTAALSGTDTNGLTESFLIGLYGTDANNVTEATSLLAVIPTSDSGTSSETSALVFLAAVSDSGTATEATTLTAVITTLADTGTITETTNVTVPIAGSDSGTGTDTAVMSLAVQVNDSNTSVTELASLVSAIAGSDTASGSETTVIVAQLATSDSGSGGDTTAQTVVLAVTDTGTDAESAAVSLLLQVSDSASATQNATATVVLNVSDLAAGADASVLAVVLSGVDTATALELVNESAALTGTDVASASLESATAALVLQVSDSGSSLESAVYQLTILDVTHGMTPDKTRAGWMPFLDWELRRLGRPGSD